MRKICTFLCVLGLVASANATVLIFDNADGSLAGGTGLIPQEYGDNVTGSLPGDGYSYGAGTVGWTPDVAVAYGPSLWGWTTSYGDFVNIMYPFTVSSDPLVYADIDVTLTASGGQQAKLYSFDVGVYGQDPSFQNVPYTVTDGLANVLDSGTFNVPLTGHLTVTVNAASADVVRLVIDMQPYGTQPPNFAIDNIEFGQVPEPATMALLGLGVLGLLRRKVRA